MKRPHLIGLLNEKTKITMVYDYGFIPIDDPRIDAEKRSIYRNFVDYQNKQRGGKIPKLTQIPYIRIAATGVESKPENIKILRLLNNLPNESGPLTKYPLTAITDTKKLKPFFHKVNETHHIQTLEGILFEMMLEATVNNEYNYDIAAFIGNESLAKIYPFMRDPTNEMKTDRRKESDVNVKAWLNIREVADIENIIKQATTKRLKNGKLINELQFIVQNWAGYVKKQLFEIPKSRLYQYRNETNDGFSVDDVEFLVVDLDSRRDWMNLLQQYREENPIPQKDDAVGTAGETIVRPPVGALLLQGDQHVHALVAGVVEDRAD